MDSVSAVGGLSNMVLFPDTGFDKGYGNLLLSMYIKVLAQALTALPALYFSVLPSLRSANSFVSDKLARFATGICEAEASGCRFDEPSLDSELSNATDDFNPPEEQSVVIYTLYGEAVEGPDTSTRMQQKDIRAWLALAKNKDDDDDDEDEDDDDDDEDDDDDPAEEEDVGDEGEGEEGVEGHAGGGGDDDDDDDEDDDENGKGDDEEDDENAVEGEDDEDDDAAEDEEDEDEEDDDDETPEPPQKKRK